MSSKYMYQFLMDRKIPTVFCVLLTIFSVNSWSITNIEETRLAPLPEGFSGKIMASIEGKNGNSDKEEYSLSGKLNLKEEKNTWVVLAERNYGKADDIVNEDAVFWHGRLTHDYTVRTASEMFIQYEEDEFTHLQFRALTGAGLRRNLFVDQESILFSYGLGGFREKEKVDLISFETTDYTTRFNLYYSYKHALNPQLVISNTAYYQPAYDDFDDYRLLFNLAMNVRINNKFSLQVDYQLRRDNEPPENLFLIVPLNIKKTDTNYKTSIVYEF